MCIDAPVSTTNSLSSGFFYGWETPVLGRWEKSRFVFLLELQDIFGQLPRSFAGTLLLPFRLFLRSTLKFWRIGGHADEDRLDKLLQAIVLSFLECQADVVWLLWIAPVELVSRFLRSSVKWTRISAAPGPEIRNPIVVCPSKKATALLSPFFKSFCWADLQTAGAPTGTVPLIYFLILFCTIDTQEDAMKHLDGFVQVPLMYSLHGSRDIFPGGLRPLGLVYRAGNCNHLLLNTARSRSIAVHDVNLFDSHPRLLTHFSHFWRQNSVIWDSALNFLSPSSSIFDTHASLPFDEFQDCTILVQFCIDQTRVFSICTSFPRCHLVGIFVIDHKISSHLV